MESGLAEIYNLTLEIFFYNLMKIVEETNLQKFYDILASQEQRKQNSLFFSVRR